MNESIPPTTTEAHNAAAAGNPIITPGEPPRLLTKQMMEDLKQQLSTPALVNEFTPEGSIVREVRAEHDQRIATQIAEIQHKLEQRRHEARDDFNMAHDGFKGAHLKR